MPLPTKSLPAAESVAGELAVATATVVAAGRGVAPEPGAVNDRGIGAVAVGRAVNGEVIAADRGAGGDHGVPAVRPGDGLAAGPHPVELAGLLHELSVRMLGADDVPQALYRLAAFVAGAVPGVLRCSVALIGEGGPPVLAASGARAKALDDRQYGTGHGPGLEAARNRVLVTAGDLQSDPRWPELAECARAEGVHGIVSFPLDVQRTSVGSLSLFVAQPGGIAPELLLTTMAVVNQAEVLLGELRRREGLSEGATVDRAAGVIIAQRGCGVQEAYDVLRETSQRLGMDRRAVAERLIAAAARNAEG
ncbi:ANTAR domain-containing protein [Actinoplanes sp. NPDC049118]|uniref:ANTAR domain-containing protein n=1 Tax=Actinoplanes sp. NPDC049118 TaxID=3155769 RepID=UPI0033DA4CBB